MIRIKIRSELMLSGVNMVQHAYELANWAHKGQLYIPKIDRSIPYMDHVTRVVQRVNEGGGDTGGKTVAWLHDVVEDTSITQEVINDEFPPYIAFAVEAITRIKERETYVEYILRVKTNAIARFVKLNDLQENISNCKDDVDWSELLQRYEKAVIELGGTSWGILDEAL